MTFNSDEINFLIFRYLQEAGYSHSAYIFGLESMISKTNIDGSLIPPGSLITLLQRALHYTDADISIAADGQERNIEAFSLLDAVIPEVIEKRKRSVQEQMQNSCSITALSSSVGTGTTNTSHHLHHQTQGSNSLSGDSSFGKDKILPNVSASSLGTGSGGANNSNMVPQAKNPLKTTPNNSNTYGNVASNGDPSHRGGMMGSGPQQTQQHSLAHHLTSDNRGGVGTGGGVTGCVLSQSYRPSLYSGNYSAGGNLYQNNGSNKANASMGLDVSGDTSGSLTGSLKVDSPNLVIPSDRVTTLKGHTSEVFICAWNPLRDILASGSGDSTARIWNLETAETPTLVLTHYVNKDGRVAISNKDVTSLDWNSEGTRLATGSYDGYARIWDIQGNPINTLGQHKGPIFALKWCKKGNYILTAGVDKSAIIWEVNTARITQQFPFHTAPTLDVDWQNNTIFASCSTDSLIHCCRLGVNEPIMTFKGHDNEVNAIKWDPTGTFLASCSDDMTLKIWRMDKDECIHDFRGHTKEIYTIRWSPKKPDGPNGTVSEYMPRYIASASFDHSVRIWDLKSNSCVRVMEKHSDPVYSVAFSPDGNLLASGSFDCWVIIWRVATGEMLHTHKCTGGIFEVCWNFNGTKVAASAADGSVVVLDLSVM